jgi:hypothetical protein
VTQQGQSETENLERGLVKRSASALIVLGLLAGIVQLADAAIGIVQNDAGKIFGPLILLGLQFYAVLALQKFVRWAPC